MWKQQLVKRCNRITARHSATKTWEDRLDCWGYCVKYENGHKSKQAPYFVNTRLLKRPHRLKWENFSILSVNPCEGGIDLGIIVDRSKSVGKENFIIVKEAVKSFVDNFDIQPEETHVSLIFFAGTPFHMFNLSDPSYHSNKAVKDAIDSLPNKLYSGTRTDLALMKAHDHMFHPGQDRRKKPNVLLVLTDGATASESAPYSETVPPLEVRCIIHVSRVIMI